MWFAVETAFIDGEHFASRPVFDMNADENSRRALAGVCYCEHYEQPHNSSQTFMNGRIEVRTDWFQTKEQAMKFCEGTITYVIYYRKEKNSFRDFIKWEAVEIKEDMKPFRGIYKEA